MAVYKIYPEKDAFILSNDPVANTGLDEIVELNTKNGIEKQDVSRIVVKYSQDHINEIVNTLNTDFSASIEYYMAEAHQVPVEFSVEAFPLYITGSKEWDNGTGKLNDVPVNKTGVSWQYIKANQSEPWTNDFTTDITGSYYPDTPGGGTWYIRNNNKDLKGEQVYKLNDDLDISINVTEAVRQYTTGELDNKGFVIKLNDSLEFSPNHNISLKYFGKDTNTIYPPTLDIKWDDSIYNTGSLGVLNTDIATVDIINNKGKFVDEGKQRFKIAARPTYPERKFVTSSIYLDSYALPEESYWGIRDENTEEMVIDFDKEFTKVSCDEKGPYFDVYMDGFQPERFYRILIKTVLDGSDVIINNENVFKVVRNG